MMIKRAALTAAALVLGGAVALSGTLPASAAESTVALNNATVRFDTNGDQIDAHDGQIQRFGDRYYLYGTSYGCGFRWNAPTSGAPFCGFVSYTSNDLVTWKPNGPLFDASGATWQAACNGATYGCFRPHVVYNASTRKYVLWINSYDNKVGYHVFTSDRPDGGFVEAPLPYLNVPPGKINVASYGDHQVFVDSDGTAYLVFTDWFNAGELLVEKLDPTYTTGSGDPRRVGVVHTEAPTIFKRGSTYYLNYSDPNDGYKTTGTSYLTASNPLGPWHGPSETDRWTVANGALSIDGGNVGLSKAGSDWTDYTMVARVTPQASDGGYGQVGLIFRAGADGLGYQWLINNAGSSGRLTKIMPDKDPVQVATPKPIVAGRAYTVQITVKGSTISTMIDGDPVDTTVDSSLPRGRVGFREYELGRERTSVDSIVVADSSGRLLMQDNFSGTLDQWNVPPKRLVGTKLTTTSCGGQPTDVLPIPGSAGTTYLYQSDKWVDRDEYLGNETLAGQHWEPLRFNADGSIQPISCTASPTVTVPIGATALTGSSRAVVSGDAGFALYHDLFAGVARQQTFAATKSGQLTAVRLNVYRYKLPDQPLVVRVNRMNADGSLGATVGSRTIAAADVPWSAKGVVVTPSSTTTVTNGERLVITVSSATTGGVGRYGFAYSDSAGFTGGEERYSNDGGATFRVESGRVLHFSADIL